MLERLSHQRNISSGGHSRVRHHRIRTHFHGIASLTRAADAGVDNNRHVRVGDDDLDEITHAQAHVGTNQRAERHNCGSTGFFKLTGCDWIREHIGHDHEAFLGQHFSGTDGFSVVRQEVFGLVFDFDFDEVGVADFACQSCNTHGFLSVTRAGGVGQQRDTFGNIVEHAVFGSLRAA